MGRIFCLMGKSSTGKDTLYRHLLKADKSFLRQIVPYTTRPIRAGEKDGVDYHFIDETVLKGLQAEGKVIEQRSYDTCHGVWRYLTVDDGSIRLSEESYLVIGTLESFTALQKYFGEDRIIPILIELDDGIRLQRALNREKKQENPKYNEMCRRFLADAEDFAEDKVRKAGISQSFQNNDLHQCLQEIQQYISQF